MRPPSGVYLTALEMSCAKINRSHLLSVKTVWSSPFSLNDKRLLMISDYVDWQQRH